MEGRGAALSFPETLDWWGNAADEDRGGFNRVASMP